jgi:hypothetical protein
VVRDIDAAAGSVVATGSIITPRWSAVMPAVAFQ